MPNAVYNRDFQPELFLQEKDEKCFLESDEGRELYENVEKYISKLFSTEQQPTASEILSGIENTLRIISIWSKAIYTEIRVSMEDYFAGPAIISFLPRLWVCLERWRMR